MDQEEYIKLWIKKADNDLKVSKRELVHDDPVLDAVCFHLQQAVEKYLKAFLAKFSPSIKKTHNLEFLLEECIQIDQSFDRFEEKFDGISECGVEIRYPDTFIEIKKDEMTDAVTLVEDLKTFVLGKLFPKSNTDDSAQDE